MMTPTLFTKPEAHSPDKKETLKKHTFDCWGNTVMVAKVIAWYVNPAIYVLFSVVYIMVGYTL